MRDVRAYLGKQLNRATRGESWLNSGHTAILAFLTIKQMSIVPNIPDLILISVLVPASLGSMWIIGWADEKFGVWKTQREHQSRDINPVHSKTLQNTEDILDKLED